MAPAMQHVQTITTDTTDTRCYVCQARHGLQHLAQLGQQTWKQRTIPNFRPAPPPPTILCSSFSSVTVSTILTRSIMRSITPRICMAQAAKARRCQSICQLVRNGHQRNDVCTARRGGERRRRKHRPIAASSKAIAR